MKHHLLLLLVASFSLSSCSTSPLERKVFCFDSMMEIKLSEGNEEDLNNIEQIFVKYDKLSDNYHSRDINNVYSINHTNEEISVDENLYNLLKISAEVPFFGANHFNFLCGSLSKKWKESLENNKVLDNETIVSELNKIRTSNLVFKDNNTVQRVGDAEVDLGAIAKGYTLDRIKEYLDGKEYKQYLINAGYSSILLGEKSENDGFYNVSIKHFDGSYLKLKNCFISTSGTAEQQKIIDGTTYSHIVDPVNGSAISKYDTVIVISNFGYLGDALSTSLMMADIPEIKAVEEQCSVQVLAIKDKTIVYKNDALEVFK